MNVDDFDLTARLPTEELKSAKRAHGWTGEHRIEVGSMVLANLDKMNQKSDRVVQMDKKWWGKELPRREKLIRDVLYELAAEGVIGIEYIENGETLSNYPVIPLG